MPEARERRSLAQLREDENYRTLSVHGPMTASEFGWVRWGAECGWDRWSEGQKYARSARKSLQKLMRSGRARSLESEGRPKRWVAIIEANTTA